ncbi:MAG: LemA family protein [Actinobacteria bacterium]|jgi:LemA protein|nr:LemA family protein [Actinomycetota bacterium]
MGALIAVIVIVVILIILALIVVGQFNKLRRLDLLSQGAFADIDTLLTKRADLVPNLVATVQGAKDFEAGTLTAVTQARSMSVQANNGSMGDKAAADGMLTAALGKLFAVAEAYPQLTATVNFQQLQGQLSEIEGQLQFSRQYYNDSVVALNTAVRTIPSMWFTGLAKVTVREMYNEPDEGRRSAPQVQF